MIWQWLTRNQEHIGRHGVSTEEAEFACEAAQPPFPREIEEGKQLVWGRSSAGRFLQVIFVFLSDEEVELSVLKPVDRLRFLAGEDEVAMIIHARDLTANEKRQYRRLTKRRS